MRGNAYKLTIAWRALPWSFIIQTLNIIESFSWAPALVVFVVHVVFVVLKTTADFVLQYRKQQIQPIQLIQLQIVFRL